jgi:hypothetical protein
MNDPLLRIKRLAYQGLVRFTDKAEAERIADGLAKDDVIESLIYAQYLRRKRSRSQYRQQKQEMVYIIESFTLDGVLVYTKGVVRKAKDGTNYYLLISAKRSGHEGSSVKT